MQNSSLLKLLHYPVMGAVLTCRTPRRPEFYLKSNREGNRLFIPSFPTFPIPEIVRVDTCGYIALLS